MVKHFQRQNGNALVIVVIVLVAILICVLGFVAWNKFLKPGVSTVRVQGNMITYNPAVVFSLSEDTNVTAKKLVGAPESFKSYIMSVFYQDNGLIQPSCSRTIAIKQIYEQMYATTTEAIIGDSTCSGSSSGIYGIVDGSWKGLASTDRSAFICQDLKQYKIPSVIAGKNCLNPKSDSTDGADYNFSTISYSQE